MGSTEGVLNNKGFWIKAKKCLYEGPPRHLLGSHTVIGISVPGGGGCELHFICGLFLSL